MTRTQSSIVSEQIHLDNAILLLDCLTHELGLIAVSC